MQKQIVVLIQLATAGNNPVCKRWINPLSDLIALLYYERIFFSGASARSAIGQENSSYWSY